MKQKIVIGVALDCDKSRRKALCIAAVAQGVSSVALEGGDNDQVVVIGEGVDLVCLARALRKKFRHASILSVSEVKEEEKKEDKKEEKKEEPKPFIYYPPCPPSDFPPHVVYDEYPTYCTIM